MKRLFKKSKKTVAKAKTKITPKPKAEKVAPVRADHQFNPYTCPPHVPGCNCPDKQTWSCNPNWDIDRQCDIPQENHP